MTNLAAVLAALALLIGTLNWDFVATPRPQPDQPVIGVPIIAPVEPGPSGPIAPLKLDRIGAARLLNQATYGPTKAAIDEVMELGYEAWIDRQIALPLSAHSEHLNRLIASVDYDIWRAERIETWLNLSVYGEDQLRQRVAFALSEIFVISDKSAVGDDIKGVTRYYDLLLKNAFGSYRKLLGEVTLSPIMGMYLSTLANEKANPERNIRPDENYAREALQLFSIGLIKLQQNGEPQLDANRNTIPTYNQKTVENFAKVYTGWNFNGANEENWWNWWDNYNTSKQMSAVDSFHDKSEKKLLRGLTTPAGQSAEIDLSQALNNIFFDPNVGPFIGKQLIQRLVTSNPTPAYVNRIAQVFNDNGSGQRGDLGAVVKAILMDREARQGPELLPNRFGKMREPILRATHLWRAFKAYSSNGRLQLGWIEHFFNQAPLSAPSVFNFFPPNYSPPGELGDNKLLGPEFKLLDDSTAIRGTNFMTHFVLWSSSENDAYSEHSITLDLSTEMAMLDQPGKLLDHLNEILLAGAMSDEMRDILKASLNATKTWEPVKRVAEIVFLIMISPQYVIQR